MEILSKYCGNVVQHYQYEKKSLPVKAADLFLLFTVTFPLIGKTHTYHRQERTFTDHRLALFEIRDSVTKAAEVFLRIVCGAATLYLAATSLPFVLLLNAALLTKFASSDNKVVHRQFLEGPKQVPQIVSAPVKPAEPVQPNAPVQMRTSSSLYSNKEYRLDGNVVESLPFSYYKALNKVIHDRGPFIRLVSAKDDRPSIRYILESGTLQETERGDNDKTRDLIVECKIGSHTVELRYSVNEAQRNHRKNLLDEMYRTQEIEVDGERVPTLPNQYKLRFNEIFDLHIDSNMLAFEKQMKEGVPVIKFEWESGSVVFVKNGAIYNSAIEENNNGHRIVVKRNFNPETFSLFNN